MSGTPILQPRDAIFAVFFVLLSCTQASDAPEQRDAPKATPSVRKPLDLAKLQATAEMACRCERAGKSKCWDEYKAQTVGYNRSWAGSACEPISVEFDCFGDDMNNCVAIKYSFVDAPGRSRPKLCTATEAQAVESAFNQSLDESLKAHPGQNEKAVGAAQDAGMRVIRAIMAGDKVVAHSPPKGCV